MGCRIESYYNHRQLNKIAMEANIGIYIAIYKGDFVYKHWSLYIECPNPSIKTIFHVIGSQGHFKQESKDHDARASTKRIEPLFHFRDVPATKLDKIKEVYESVVVKNDDPSWNCQDYVLDLLRALGTGGVFPKDGLYFERYNELAAKQDGIV